jgi:hypothetical protein
MELMEIWTRDYQVLPERTHPTMKMHAASGYLLAGIKVAEGGQNEDLEEKETEQQAKKQKVEENQ